MRQTGFLCKNSAFLELNYGVEVSVGPVRSYLNSPETRECSKIIRHLFFLLLPAFYHKACRCSAMDWCRLWAPTAEDSHWQATWRQEQWEKDQKPLKLLLSVEDEVSVDHKPECPIKDSRGCSLYIQQHHSKSKKGQNGHQENKALHFSPALIAEGCETFMFFHHFPQKVSI